MINWNRKRRWIALLMLLAGIFVMLNVPPVVPVIQLPGEVYPEGWEFLGLRITNTFVGSIVVWILLLLLMIYIARRKPKDGSEVPPGGFYNTFEMAFEGLFDFVGNIAGEKYFNLIFKVFMTIFLIVLLSNWLELVPGIDSVGFIEPHLELEFDPETGEVEEIPTTGFETYQGFLGTHSLNGKCPWVSPATFAEEQAAAAAEAEAAAMAAFEAAEEAIALAEFRDESVSGLPSPEAAAEAARQEALTERQAAIQARIDNGCVTGVGLAMADDHAEEEEADEHDDEEDAEVAADAGEDHDEGEGGAHHPPPGDPSVPWVVLPFVRVPSTDLNMTLALALVAFAMTQYAGFKELGPGYLKKFFNFGTLFKSPLGGIDVFVGLLELIGEFARILSFSFRLLGNIFAGSILIFVISFLLPFLPWPVFILEFFVGIIQALVFALLTAIFMNLATQSHHHDDEHEAGGAH